MKNFKKVLIILLALMMIFTCFGCGNKKDSEYAESINILIYPDYVSEDVIAKFEEEYGIKVNVTFLEYEEDNITRLEMGDDFDIVQPCQETAHSMIEEGLLLEINKADIPNLANLYKLYETYDYPGEENYTIPYMCGSYSIIVNKDTCPVEITSFSDLANPALKGQIASVDIDRRLVATILAEQGLDPNTEDKEELYKVFDILTAYNDNVKVYDNGAPRTSVENGECSVAVTYTTDYVLINQEMPEGNWEIVETKYYSRGEWMFAIPKASTKVTEAELFINFFHDPQNYADNLVKYPGVGVNEKANEYLPADVADLFKAFDIPEGGIYFTLGAQSSEAIELYDLFIADVMAN